MFPAQFEQRRLTVADTDYLAAVGGAGPPVLLHGFPQTHLCCDRVAPHTGLQSCRALRGRLGDFPQMRVNGQRLTRRGPLRREEPARASGVLTCKARR
jgi:hypothetical protein